MGRKQKPKSFMSEIARFIMGSSFLVGIYVYMSTSNMTLAALAFCGICSIAIAIPLISRSLRDKKYINSGFDVIDKMTGTEFEEFLLAHFKFLGYQGHLTPVTADYGADLVLKKDGIKTVVQAKRHKQKVGLEAVQQILGAMGHYKANKAIVITNNYCSENAYVLAASNNVEIWNRDVLQDFISKTKDKTGDETNDITKDKTSVQDKEPNPCPSDICPRCSGNIIAKKGKYGEFFGCSSYPKCTYTCKALPLEQKS